MSSNQCQKDLFMRKGPAMKKLLCVLSVSLIIVSYAASQETSSDMPDPVRLTNDQDLARIKELLGVKVQRPGRDGM
ncbi:MAG: hypothetical protein P8016_10665, partial [Sedimentisphaerales bacterium]